MVTDLTRSAPYAGLSLWFDTCGDPLVPRPPLPGDRDVDVAIVGGGFTGLWTAYQLIALDPSLRVAVLEAEIAGFGASGRNGGWCSALWPTPIGADVRRTLEATVDAVGRWCTDEGIDADFAKGGVLHLARSASQEARLRSEPFTRWLSAEETRQRVLADAVRGAAYDSSCAALHPGKLVRGLARVIAARGVDVYERTRVQHIAPHVARTDRGRVRADVVVRATEGFTARLPGYRRSLAPVYSLVLATEPVPAEVLQRLRWDGRETLTDGRRLIIYAQRSADGRVVFGGRGAPYHLGSRIRPGYDQHARVHGKLHAALVDLFPPLRDVAVTHRWGGPLGVPRDFTPSVGFDRASGLAWAGGYVGDGVAASHLAGRTLADLVLDRDTDLVHLPWVGHRSPQWEPEPVRWLGVNAGRLLAASVDRADDRGRTPRRRARFLDRLTGH